MFKANKLKIILPLALVFLFFLPFFWNHHDFNNQGDNSAEFLNIIRLFDARFSFSLDPAAIYANPIFQIFSNDHGALKTLIFFPVFYVLDLVRVPLTEPVITSAYLTVCFLVLAACFLILRQILPLKKAWAFFLLLAAIPYMVMQMHYGSWPVYAWLPFIAGFYFLDKFLKTEKRSALALFSLAACLYIISTPGFFFGGIFCIIFASVFLKTKLGSFKNVFSKLLAIMKIPWLYLPFLLIGLEITALIIAKAKFGYGFGLMAKILAKSQLAPSYGWKTLASFLLSGLGLTGLALWPAILIAYGRSIFCFNKINNVYLKSAVIFFTFVFLLLLFAAMGSGAYSYELYFPGLLILVYALFSIKNKAVRYSLLGAIIATGYAQSLLYTFNYQPKNFLVDPKYFIQRDNGISDACLATWCPYFFRDWNNVGFKTLGFVARNYLQISPLPYVSKEKNFDEWQNDFFLHTDSCEAPTLAIGRRTNYKIQYIADAKIIAALTPEALAISPLAADRENNQQVLDFLAAHPRYKLEAVITIGGQPTIKVYALDGTKPLKTFPVEIYDREFDRLYSNLKSLSHIDLGKI